MTMPPSPSVVIFTPRRPTPATFTANQFLAYSPQIPSQAARISANVPPSRANRPTHKSTAAGDKYDIIHPVTLYPIPKIRINMFREIIDSMESIQFSQPMALPWDASPMLSEGGVTSYLDVQILGAAWQVVLQMIPDERDYELQMGKQVSLVEGTPDHTFSVLREDTSEPLVVVEFKPTGVVQGLLSVIENTANGVRVDPTDDWKAVTRQLRMYAAGSNLHDVLLMDESVAIYFRFPPDLSNPNYDHAYLCASSKLGACFGDNPCLSVRELVVFALLSVFERKNIEISDDLHRAASSVNVVPTSRPYRNVLSTWAPPPNSKRRRDPSARLAAQKRGRRNDSIRDGFNDCFLDATLSFENLPNTLLPRPVTIRPHQQSLDSYFHDGAPSSTPHTSPAKPTTTSVTIVRILKPGVAVVTDGRTQFVAKLFPSQPGSTPDKHLALELAVYAACATLQGSCIPYLYATGHVAASDTFILPTEFIGCGTTVADVIHALDEADMKKLTDLQPGAAAALHALHEMKVVHRDVAGRNMVLDECGGVVIVDFGRSRVVGGDLARFRSGREEDEAALRAVFDVRSL